MVPFFAPGFLFAWSTKARALISIAASQLVEPMPVDCVKEIDPISSAITEPLRDSP
jgi:hypothetical protein